MPVGKADKSVGFVTTCYFSHGPLEAALAVPTASLTAPRMQGWLVLKRHADERVGQWPAVAAPVRLFEKRDRQAPGCRDLWVKLEKNGDMNRNLIIGDVSLWAGTKAERLTLEPVFFKGLLNDFQRPGQSHAQFFEAAPGDGKTSATRQAKARTGPVNDRELALTFFGGCGVEQNATTAIALSPYMQIRTRAPGGMTDAFVERLQAWMAKPPAGYGCMVCGSERENDAQVLAAVFVPETAVNRNHVVKKTKEVFKRGSKKKLPLDSDRYAGIMAGPNRTCKLIACGSVDEWVQQCREHQNQHNAIAVTELSQLNNDQHRELNRIFQQLLKQSSAPGQGDGVQAWIRRNRINKDAVSADHNACRVADGKKSPSSATPCKTNRKTAGGPAPGKPDMPPL